MASTENGTNTCCLYHYKRFYTMDAACNACALDELSAYHGLRISMGNECNNVLYNYSDTTQAHRDIS